MIGNVVGNYKITEKIGEGGMGAVFKGVDLMLEREVAVKVLRPEFASQPELVERFRSEAVTLAKLNHPNIATLHSFFRQANDFFMVMEYVRGEALDSVIRRGGAMEPQQAVAHFCQALDGIGRAHKLGIVHRDIKPANVMITEDGSIKVMDFGIARVLGTARMTKQGNIIGTIEYMSPEAIQGHEVDGRADIYSLGILLYEMLTGRVPFEADTEFSLMMAQIQQAPPPPRTFAPHIPLGVEQAIMRSLAKKPEARFQTAADFRGALEGGAVAATTLPTAPKPTTPPTRLGEPPTAPYSQQVTIPIAAGSDPMGLAQANQPKGDPPGSGVLRPAFISTASVPYATETPLNYQVAPPRASLFSRLNWKHYSAAAAILLLLLSVPLILVVVLREQIPPQRPPVADRPPESSNPSPSVETKAPASNPVASQPAIAPGGEPPRAPSGPSETVYPGGGSSSAIIRRPRRLTGERARQRPSERRRARPPRPDAF